MIKSAIKRVCINANKIKYIKHNYKSLENKISCLKEKKTHNIENP